MKNINTIQKVKVTDRHFDVMQGKAGNSWCVELTLDKIITYHINNGSRKHLGLVKTPVDKAVMKTFFEDLYNFVRNASEEGYTEDDCSHEVQFIYSECHKETFYGWTGNVNEFLTSKIHRFVDQHT